MEREGVGTGMVWVMEGEACPHSVDHTECHSYEKKVPPEAVGHAHAI